MNTAKPSVVPVTWRFAAMDPIQARNHLAAQMAVQRIAAQAQAARLEACLLAWRQRGEQ